MSLEDRKFLAQPLFWMVPLLEQIFSDKWCCRSGAIHVPWSEIRTECCDFTEKKNQTVRQEEKTVSSRQRLYRNAFLVSKNKYAMIWNSVKLLNTIYFILLNLSNLDFPKKVSYAPYFTRVGLRDKLLSFFSIVQFTSHSIHDCVGYTSDNQSNYLNGNGILGKYLMYFSPLCHEI